MPTPKPVKNKVKSFAPKKYEDHIIVDDAGSRVGHVRVKPSGVLWSPSSGKFWYGIPIAKFGEFMVQNGKKQKK